MNNWQIIDPPESKQSDIIYGHLKQFIAQEHNGLTDVPVDIPLIRSHADVVTNEYLIQVKHIDDFTTGIGELITYKVRFSSRKLILHLFSEMPVNDKKLITIQEICDPLNITVEFTHVD